MSDDTDPVVESYDVFVSKPELAGTRSQNAQPPASRLLLLQYPAHRPSSKPYTSSRSQQPTTLRLKPETGMVEVEVPLITTEYYDHLQAAKFGKALADNRSLQSGASLGLAGGFSTGHQSASNTMAPLSNERHYVEPTLHTQTLGGKIAVLTERDPIYMLGRLKDGELHLSQLDAVVQMRPQLHHVDAEDENNQKRLQNNLYNQSNKANSNPDGGPTRIESRAVEVKIKDNRDDARDRNLNTNAKMLRQIQAEEWQEHSWVEAAHLSSAAKHGKRIAEAKPELKSSISNNDWLDRMSAPRADGKKGLLAKLRGRERERARRKKAEEEKRSRAVQESALSTTGANHPLDMSSDSNDDDESDSHSSQASKGLHQKDTQDVEMVDRELSEADIKQEPASALATAPLAVPAALATDAPQSSMTQPKRRGRPRKNTAERQISK